MAMKSADKLAMVKSILNIEDTAEDKRIEVFLSAAAREIMSWRYSYSDQFHYSDDPGEVPVEYEMTQVFAVVAGYSQSGAENETAHSENGVSRTFKHSDMVAYIRSHVIPLVKVM